MAGDNDRSLTPNAYAKLLRVHPDKVRRWIKSGELVATNVAEKPSGKPQWRITRKQAEDFERKRSSETQAALTAQAKQARRPRRRTSDDIEEFFK